MELKRMQELAGIKSNQTALEMLADSLRLRHKEAYDDLYEDIEAYYKEIEKKQMIDFAKKCSTESAPDEYYEEIYNDTF